MIGCIFTRTNASIAPRVCRSAPWRRSSESDVPEKWKSYIAENREKLAGAANITVKKEPLGKDKPECQPGARKP